MYVYTLEIRPRVRRIKPIPIFTQLSVMFWSTLGLHQAVTNLRQNQLILSQIIGRFLVNIGYVASMTEPQATVIQISAIYIHICIGSFLGNFHQMSQLIRYTTYLSLSPDCALSLYHLRCYMYVATWGSSLLYMFGRLHFDENL